MKQPRLILPLLATVLLLILLQGRPIYASLRTNLAWAYTAHAILSDPMEERALLRAGDLFRTLQTHPSPRGPEAAWGALLVQAEQARQAKAVPLAPAGVQLTGSPDRLLALSDWYANRGDPAHALTLLTLVVQQRAASQNAWDRISAICRQHVPDLVHLGSTAQDLCQETWARFDRNLITDGQFDAGSFAYWERHFTPGSDYIVDPLNGQPEPSAHIATATVQYHGGLYQTIRLPASATVTFEARLKIVPAHDDDPPLRVLPLYVARTVNGEKRVGAGAALTNTTGWQTVSRSFQVDAADNMQLFFYPAYIYGRGDVWIDDVRIVVTDATTSSHRPNPADDISL